MRGGGADAPGPALNTRAAQWRRSVAAEAAAQFSPSDQTQLTGGGHARLAEAVQGGEPGTTPGGRGPRPGTRRPARCSTRS
eukprot:2541543-Rhodomonas_salina.1